MADLEKLLQIGTNGSALEVVRGRKNKHPKGWEAGITLGEAGGFVVTEPMADEPSDWDAILNELLPPSLDRSMFTIDQNSPVEVRAWDGNVGGGVIQRFYYFKARILRRDAATPSIDLTELINDAKAVDRVKLRKLTNERAYFAQITDLQAGQADGDGVAGMVSRALELADLVCADVEYLAKSNRPVSQIFIPITGDLVEGIVGWYEMQQFSVQLDRREQVKLVRRLLSQFLLSLSKLKLPIHVAAVAGNHGENRSNGKAFTTLSDNDDLAIVEQIAEAFELAGRKEFTFTLPQKDRLSMTVEVLGNIVGLTHGHIARAGSGVEGKILGWFKSMAATRDPIGDSDILFTGHYHHARYQQLIGDTTWIQGGALCDTSAWFSQSFGLVSDPVFMKGTITRDGVEAVLPHTWARSKPKAREI
jgi:predicted phosphodiesterase